MFESPDLGVLSVHPAAGLGICRCRSIYLIWVGRGPVAVSAVRVVRGGETAPARCVAELSVTR